MAEAEDRTEDPSARRLARAREEGDVLFSREALVLIGLASGLAALLIGAPGRHSHPLMALRSLMLHAGDRDVDLALCLRQAWSIVLSLVLPVATTVSVMTMMAGLLQTRFLLRPAALMPDIGRLSPLKGIKRIFGPEGLTEGGKSVAKAVLLGVIILHAATDVVENGSRMVGLGVAGLAAAIQHSAMVAGGDFLIGYALIVGFDIFWRYRRRLGTMRMSRQEVKDEYKETEGDPHIKGRIRQIRMKMARQRMLHAVKDATVVVTNPTHYAVALVYERGKQAAPRIVAKGVDEVAARIREAAQAHKVPLVPNPPLARALYPLPLDTEIPAEHFKVVASIIAMVWRMKRAAAAHRPA